VVLSVAVSLRLLFDSSLNDLRDGCNTLTRLWTHRWFWGRTLVLTVRLPLHDFGLLRWHLIDRDCVRGVGGDVW